jgi:hypothetical protein
VGGLLTFLPRFPLPIASRANLNARSVGIAVHAKFWVQPFSYNINMLDKGHSHTSYDRAATNFIT